MGGMPSHTLCRWRGNASMLIEAYIHSPCAEWGYELDKITRLQRSRLHSGVKAHRGGADESAFTHTAAPCEGPLAALPRHLAVILLARLQRRTSVIFGSVSYAFQPQKPSEGDQKNGQETGVVEASNTKRLQLGVDGATLVAASQHEARQHRHALPVIESNWGAPVPSPPSRTHALASLRRYRKGTGMCDQEGAAR